MSLNLSIQRLRFQAPLPSPITVGLYIKEYYSSVFTLIQNNVNVDVNGYVLASPYPSTNIDPTKKYVLRAVNLFCDYVYDQDLIINPYCPPGYAMASDESYCFISTTVAATPPTSSQNTVSVTQTDYSAFGTLIYDLGFNVNGTGTFTQIPYTNTFWLNGTGGYPTGTGSNTSLGPLNRTGLWTSSPLSNQVIGFSQCITVPVDGVYYIGTGSDNFTSINVDSINILSMDATAMGLYLNAHGYSNTGQVNANCTFRFWHVYPVYLSAGTHILEVIGNNVSSVASIGVEIYNATPADLTAATSYVALGAKLLFSSKDTIGQPVQLGNMGVGYSCPPDYALDYCGSPIVCTKFIKVPILY